MITGLSLADGSVTPQHVILQIDSDKKAYVILPNGSVLTSVSGLINTTWSGVAGKTTRVIPINNYKYSTYYNSSSSSATGDLTLKNSIQIEVPYSSIESISSVSATILDCNNCSHLKTINIPKMWYCNAPNCPSLTSDSIYSILNNAYSLFLKGKLTGTVTLNGTTTEIDIFDISSVHGINYQSMITAMTGWSITVNAA